MLTWPSQIKADIEQCSRQLIAPLLSEIHASLPLELRENIYEHVFDTSKPIIIQRTKAAGKPFTNGEIQPGNAEASNHAIVTRGTLNPFVQDFYFSVTVMGSETSTEIQNLALRKTPFYFRGSNDALCVRELLDTEIRPGVYFRYLVRHLRVYIRSDAFVNEALYFVPGVVTPTAAESKHQILDEASTYGMYLDRLEGLETLSYADHTITLELCVLAPEWIPHQPGIKRNLYEVVEPVYRHARDRGADVKVRYETFSTGAGEDWTEYLEVSSRDAAQVCQSHQTISPQYTDPAQSKQPHRTFDEISSSASSLQDLFNAAIPTSTTNISWKHGLYEGPCSECYCEPCKEDKARICPRSGGRGHSHTFPLTLDYDEGDNNPKPMRRWARAAKAAARQARASGS